MKEKEAQKKAQELENEELRTQWKARMDELVDQEKREKEDKANRNKELKDYQKKQSDTIKQNQETTYAEELRVAALSKAMHDQEEKHFYSYADKCMQEWKDKGKNIKGLLMELKDYKGNNPL